MIKQSSIFSCPFLDFFSSLRRLNKNRSSPFLQTRIWHGGGTRGSAKLRAFRRPDGEGGPARQGGGGGDATVPKVQGQGDQVLLLRQLRREPAAALVQGRPPAAAVAAESYKTAYNNRLNVDSVLIEISFMELSFYN